MSKHLADHQVTTDGSRARRFAEVERRSGAEGSHPAAQAVHRRPADRTAGKRTEEFVRIERGGEA